MNLNNIFNRHKIYKQEIQILYHGKVESKENINRLQVMQHA